jgi:hypothetical protein
VAVPSLDFQPGDGGLQLQAAIVAALAEIFHVGAETVANGAKGIHFDPNVGYEDARIDRRFFSTDDTST